MLSLSISKAWEESRSRFGSDGRLIVTVALAMVALPSAISTFVNPDSSMAAGSPGLGVNLLVLAMSLVTLIGQLAIIRLAIGPSVSVGGAIGHAFRRALPYLGAIILLVIAMLLLAIPFVFVLGAAGVSFEPGDSVPPVGWLVLIGLTIVFIYIAVRMLMTSPVASAEKAGPITILKRSWALTRGHVLKLLGFLLLFLVAALVAVIAIGAVSVLLARLLFGEVEPMNGAALFLALIQGLVSAAVTAVLAVMMARIYLQLVAEDQVEVSVPSSGT